MKAPFFLLGFLAMLITVSAFAEVKTEQREYDQKIQSLVPGMELKFPSGFLLEAAAGGSAWKTLRLNGHTCFFFLDSATDVRLVNALSWHVEEVSFPGGKLAVRLGSGTNYAKRVMHLSCNSTEVSVEVLRLHGITVPKLRPVKVDLIRADETEILPQRDENATVAI